MIFDDFARLKKANWAAEKGYARTEMPEKVTIARPRIGTPKALAGSKTLESSWLAIWVRTRSSSGPATMWKS